MAAIVETKEQAKEELLQTHYYKTSYDNLKELYFEIAKKLGLRLVSIDDNYCEIFAEKPHLTVLAKIIEQNPKETSIDFYISAEYLFGNVKKALDVLDRIYKEIEKTYELKGLGLHK